MSEGVCVEALTLTLGAFRLKNIDFAVSPGEVLVILGPNGAGKSVMLETIAGFHRPRSGRVLIAGRDVTALPPERRNIGFVVQNFGLFPHLSVAHNVAIARRQVRIHAVNDAILPAFRDDAALLAYFGVAHLAARLPAGLSPGEKQRVALARALAGAPDLFLLDEPFSALDGQTRDQLRGELESFLRKLAIPAIFVTHDRDDAMMLADKIVVLRDGTIMQSGTAAEIFQKPANSFIARFVGVENVLLGRVTDASGGFLSVKVGERTLRAAATANSPGVGTPVYLCTHGEDVTLCPTPGEPRAETNRLEGRITALRSLGPLATLTVDCGFALNAYLLGRQARDLKLRIGSLVAAEIAPEAIHVTLD